MGELDEEVGLNYTVVVDHTKLAEISDEHFDQFISIPLNDPLGYAALRPLLLLDSLPGLERWKRALDVNPLDDDWNTLAKAFAQTLDHQSEKSTDIRWFKLILPIISGRMCFQPSMADDLESLRLFPDKGDMRRVRPLICSNEMILRRNPPSSWVQALWAELLEKTDCLDPSRERQVQASDGGKYCVKPRLLCSVEPRRNRSGNGYEICQSAIGE